jgi:hypothetical protein
LITCVPMIVTGNELVVGAVVFVDVVGRERNGVS